MSPTPTAAEHQADRAATAAATARAVRPLWEQVDPEDLEESWLAQLAQVVALVAAGQLAAARQAGPYLARLLPGEPAEGEVNAEELAGVAGDGRDLSGLLAYPVYVALNRIRRGFSVAWSIASGAAFLELLTRTLVADAGRAADLVGMIARPAVTSYMRVVQVGACARCIVLAGREYGISDGFLRHPRCQCTMEPITRTHTPTPVMPEDVYAQMTEAQRRHAFGPDAVKAIADGADIAQVVNARRGMTTATLYGKTVRATREGTTRRGIAGRRRSSFERRPGERYSRARGVRLMPAEIYARASSREEAIALLRKHAYIV
ncbi:hypothetical protein [Streptomyces sp. CNQ085]|uniref:hypothetical protein n=1 Tax=Streptomyces sp. CNQ085 TaxID=2886944 RepID=UPI001F50FC6A|nr:hypothetical protein [Streptomyces sp. CNQ085]MCI0386659.1 hypothetical protein [Streptomyces sp. CNQ085]